MPHHYAQSHHSEDDGERSDDGRYAHLDDLLEREVKTQREQKEHHTYVRPRLDVAAVDYGHGIRHVRTDNESSHDIAQHERLLEFLEYECDRTRHNKYKGKVVY